MARRAEASAEDRLIARFFAPLATARGAYGLTDDAALIAPPKGRDLVVTCDAIVAGVHFLPDDPPDTIARKALRVNLSDLAAKGATPLGCVMALALPDSANETWLKPFARALGADCVAYGCALLGGDTVRMPGPLTVSITAFGHVGPGGMVRRVGARPGDLIFVTGTIGDAALGLDLLRRPALAAKHGLSRRDVAALIARYREPQPRNALARGVASLASAAMDVSDGLAGDLAKLCRVSGVGARLDLPRLPLSAAARRLIKANPACLERALTGGDDYEILCTVPAERARRFAAAAARASVAVTEIGTVTRPGQVTVVDEAGRAVEFRRAAFSHF